MWSMEAFDIKRSQQEGAQRLLNEQLSGDNSPTTHGMVLDGAATVNQVRQMWSELSAPEQFQSNPLNGSKKQRPESGLSRLSATPSLDQVLEEAGSEASTDLGSFLHDLKGDHRSSEERSQQYIGMLTIGSESRMMALDGQKRKPMSAAAYRRSPVNKHAVSVHSAVGDKDFSPSQKKVTMRAQSAGGQGNRR